MRSKGKSSVAPEEGQPSAPLSGSPEPGPALDQELHSITVDSTTVVSEGELRENADAVEEESMGSESPGPSKNTKKRSLFGISRRKKSSTPSPSQLGRAQEPPASQVSTPSASPRRFGFKKKKNVSPSPPATPGFSDVGDAGVEEDSASVASRDSQASGKRRLIGFKLRPSPLRRKGPRVDSKLESEGKQKSCGEAPTKPDPSSSRVTAKCDTVDAEADDASTTNEKGPEAMEKKRLFGFKRSGNASDGLTTVDSESEQPARHPCPSDLSISTLGDNSADTRPKKAHTKKGLLGRFRSPKSKSMQGKKEGGSAPPSPSGEDSSLQRKGAEVTPE